MTRKNVMRAMRKLPGRPPRPPAKKAKQHLRRDLVRKLTGRRAKSKWIGLV